MLYGWRPLEMANRSIRTKKKEREEHPSDVHIFGSLGTPMDEDV